MHSNEYIVISLGLGVVGIIGYGFLKLVRPDDSRATAVFLLVLIAINVCITLPRVLDRNQRMNQVRETLQR